MTTVACSFWSPWTADTQSHSHVWCVPCIWGGSKCQLPLGCELEHHEFFWNETQTRQFVPLCVLSTAVLLHHFSLHCSLSWLIHSIILCCIHELRRYAPVVLCNTYTHKLQKVLLILFLCSSSVIESCADNFLTLFVIGHVTITLRVGIEITCGQEWYYSQCLGFLLVILSMQIPYGHYAGQGFNGGTLGC